MAANSSWPLLIIVAVGAIAFLLGLGAPEARAKAFSSAVLTATLAAVAWYSVESRLLRLGEQRDREIRDHPWLKATDLKPEWDKDHGGLAGRDMLFVPITNVGATPAHDVRLKVRWRLRGVADWTGQSEIRGVVLVPHDTWHAAIGVIDWESPDEQAELEVEVTFATSLGGGGRLMMSFYSHDKGWANGPMSHNYWLSDGRRFPEAHRAATVLLAH